ncbi:MAG TPA: hypothetical protein VFO84_02410 [Dehalococcoidia bacterium]|nr:hypothetical protein [Dehalococcoidia bacterium]
MNAETIEQESVICMLGEGGPCVDCGGRLAEILWGFPSFSEEVQAGLDSGDIQLGGCCLPAPDVPTHRCRACGREYILKLDDTEV